MAKGPLRIITHNERLTEQEMIEGCINNSRKAQRELFNTYFNEMLGLCMLYCKDNEDSRWVANQGFMDVFMHIGGFRKDSSLKTWIKRLMINRAINFYNQQQALREKQVLMDYSQLVEISSQSLDTDALRKMQADDIIALIRSLPFNERTVFTLYEMEGYSHREIAEMLGFVESTSRWHLCNAKKTLQHKISNLKLNYYDKAK
jgi:RNA polymerase sigma factor (sigma-70 family)